MSNKLKKIFEEKEDFYKGTIRFKNKDAYLRFLKEINNVYQNGEVIQLDDVQSMDWAVDLGTELFPLEQLDKIEKVTVGPSIEEHNIPIRVNGKNVLYQMNKIILENGILLQSKQNTVVNVKMFFDQKTGLVKMSFAPHIENAADVNSVIESINHAEGLLDAIIDDKYRDDEDYKDLRHHLEDLHDIFERLLYVEKMFNRQFKMKDIDMKDVESLQDLFELCLTVRDNKVIRISDKMNFSELSGTGFKTENVIYEGEVLDLTYLSEIDFFIWGESIKLHSANLVHNAMVKKIEELETGNKKIIYGEKESDPMSISYKGFKNEIDAKEELKHLMDHRDDYINAKTAEQYYNDRYSMYDDH